MKMTLHPTIIYRVPQFCYEDSFQQSWKELKHSISESSQTFFNEIKDVEFDQINSLPVKAQQTIWKYFNRARYRATPYGSFAAIGSFPSNSQARVPITISNKQQIHRWTDWPKIDEITFDFADLEQSDTRLFTNSSYYPIGKDTRYIGRFEGKYELVDIELSAQQIQVLNLCAKPIRVSELVKKFSVPLVEMASVLEQLLIDQLLLCELNPNIIGEDYFKRIGISADSSEKEYLIAEREWKHGSLDAKLLNHLPDLIDKLSRVIPGNNAPDLDEFARQFAKKYESAEVPIMKALDPELGIGYGKMEQSVLVDELINQLNQKKDTKQEQGLPDKFRQSLLGFTMNNNKQVIKLDDLYLPEAADPVQLPNTMSILCTVSDDLVQIENMGGCSANALLGRFTQVNENIHEHCKKLVEIEASANPEVIFFDIAYMVGNVIDNVNRRKSIYDYQLSILNYDTSELPITLDDLMLSVFKGEVFIRSKKLNRRMIPRLASAYNYQKSDLPIFRLLCDIQQHNLHLNLTLPLNKIIPGLDFYPRLQFHNLILSPATWKLESKDLKQINGELPGSWLEALIKQKGLCRYVKTGYADQTLCYDLNNATDKLHLEQFLLKYKKIEVEEVLLPKNSSVINEQSKPFLAEFVISAFHTNRVYSLLKMTGFNDSQYKIQAANAPGSKWLYFEIFCHSMRANEILISDVLVFLKNNQVLIEEWFFIRYNEEGDHLRLRLKIKNPQSSGMLIEALNKCLEDKLSAGLISELLMKTYKRELDRYGSRQIEGVESHFCKDSEYVLKMISHDLSAFERYQHCINVVDRIVEKGAISTEQYQRILKACTKGFAAEHKFTPVEFKLLNAEYQKFNKTEKIHLPSNVRQSQEIFIDSFIQTINDYPDEQKIGIFSSLFHMHVNRFFSDQQRIHEAVLYYFMDKALLRSQKTKMATFI